MPVDGDIDPSGIRLRRALCRYDDCLGHEAVRFVDRRTPAALDGLRECAELGGEDVHRGDVDLRGAAGAHKHKAVGALAEDVAAPANELEDDVFRSGDVG